MYSLQFPWRVVADYGAAYDLAGADGVRTAAAPTSRGVRPAAGDYVRIDDRGRIAEVAQRGTCIVRARSGGEPQIVAANVTAAFVVTSPDAREFSPRRVSRYLIALRAGGVDAAVLLNKADCDRTLAAHLDALRAVADGAPVLPVCARDGTGCDALFPYLTPESTIALCGSSGVGKSTLLNRLAGTEVMATQTVRDDGRGRHTTTLRRLVTIAGGASLVDTPGMRSFLPFAPTDGVDGAFGDVAAAARRCRFADCAHAGEPGCAVRDAIDGERLEQWHKLRRELAWLETRDDPLAAIERKRRWKAIHKAARRPAR